MPAYRLLVAFPTGNMVQHEQERSASHNEAVEVTMICDPILENQPYRGIIDLEIMAV